MPESIRLEPAFAWDCPRCNARNYNDLEPVQLQESELRALYLESGLIESWQDTPDTEVEASPDSVQCARCLQRFECVSAEEDGEGDVFAGFGTEG